MLGVAQQVAVVDGAQPEVLEAVVGGLVDDGVELGSVGVDEGDELFGQQPVVAAGGDRGGEGHDAFGLGLLGDVLGQQPGGELGVARLGGDGGRGDLDGAFPQVGEGGAGPYAALDLGGDAVGVDVGEADGVGADLLGDGDGEIAVGLTAPLRWSGGGGGCRGGEPGHLCIPS